MKTPLCFLAGILLLACDTRNEHLLDPDFVSYFAPGKEGSFWVYKNTVSQVSDTFYVENYRRFFWKEKPNSEKNLYEIIEFDFNNPSNSIRCHIEVDSDRKNLGYYSGAFFEDQPIIYYSNHEFEAYKGSKELGVNKLIRKEIGGTFYEDVLVSWNGNDSLVYSKNIGIIQFNLYDTKYILVNYKLNNP